MLMQDFLGLVLGSVLILQRLTVALETKALFSPIQALLNKSTHPYLNSLHFFLFIYFFTYTMGIV